MESTANDKIRSKGGTVRLFYWIGAILVAVLVFWYALQGGNLLSGPIIPASKVRNIVSDTNNGNYSEALQQYEMLVSSGDLTPDQEAFAVKNVFASLLKARGNVDDMVRGVADIKHLIEDTRVSPRNRADLIRLLGIAYSESGASEVVYDAIFTGDTYSDLLVVGNDARSLRNIYDWSYDIYPTSRTGIAITFTYAKEALTQLYDDGTSGTNTEEGRSFADAAASMMREAEGLREKEEQTGMVLPEQARYWNYLYEHAFTTGALAIVEGAPYTQKYETEFDTLATRLEREASVEAKQLLGLTYWTHANFTLLIDNNTEKAAALLQALVAFVRSDPRIEVNEFAIFVRNLSNAESGEKRFYNSAMERLSAISPEFKKLVEDMRQ